MKRILSYGGGVQTRALGRLIMEGRFERPDLVVFADTQQEPVRIMRLLDQEFALFDEAGIEAVSVSRGDLADWKRNGSVHVPLHIVDGTGNAGMLRRTCTSRFKTECVESEARFRGWHREGYEVWIGFSTDEIMRVKPAKLSYITNRWPLIELNLSRAQCEAILRERGQPLAKSACVFCPFKSWRSWDGLHGTDRKRAIAYDESVRDALPDAKCYVHRGLRPLKELTTAEAPPTLFGIESECDDGNCWT
jgi:hypothetical protein